MIFNAALQADRPNGTARLAACVLAVVLVCLALAGCSSSGGETAEQSSGSTDAASQQKTVVSVLCANQLAGPLSELEQLYASENDDVQFSQDSEGSSKALRRAWRTMPKRQRLHRLPRRRARMPQLPPPPMALRRIRWSSACRTMRRTAPRRRGA